jgi:WD40 repeat protein
MYNVAPMFCPPSSWLHECYSLEFSYRVKVVVGPAQWGTCIRTIHHVTSISALAYWNNNVATSSSTGCDIIILDALTGSQTAILSGHTGHINSLTYSSDGTFLVSGSDDKTIKLWDVQTGGVIKILHGYTDCIYSVSISADNTMVASLSKDRMVCIENIETRGYYIDATMRYGYYADTVAFSPQNPQLLYLIW